MRIFFTGATGVIGTQTVPLLVGEGHDVTAVHITDDQATWLAEVGATPVAVDLFDAAAVAAAVDGMDVVIHMATAIPPQSKMPKRESWAMNDRLRTEATKNLVNGALAGGVGAFIQQSVAFAYADGATTWLDEDSPIEPVWDVMDTALFAESEVVRFTAAGGRGIVLRLASLYGPGKASEEYAAAVADRKLPIVGGGANYVSHIHSHDVATAIVAALQAPAGTYNIADDQPVTKRVELDALARTLGAPPPRTAPRWIARLMVGGAANMLTVSHRVSNRRFKDVTGWEPRFPSVLDGWASAVEPVAR